MIFKYKKAYQEVNEDIVDPPNETCRSLLTVTGTYDNGGNRHVDVQYILCNDNTNTVVTESFTGISGTPVILTVNECIKENSLYVNTVNITNESPTTIPNFLIQVDFDSCDNPCFGVTETASVINNIVYQTFPAGYLVNCTLNSYCYLQYSEDGTTWITYPTLYAPGSNNFLVTVAEDKVKFRFVSNCQSIYSNVFWITSEFCFTPFYECDDTIHVPPGGTVTYINSAGNTVVQSGLCGSATEVIINAVSITSSSGVAPC